ncbi:MAG: O-antigen ligase family protein [Ferruginibacter sp.]
MEFSGLKILGFLNVAVFLGLMLFIKGNKNRVFIQYILLSFPLLSIFIQDMVDGFDVITILFTLLFYRKRDVQLYNGFIYGLLFVVLLVDIFIGLFLAGQMGSETIRDIIGTLTIFMFARILSDELIYDTDFFYKVTGFLKITLVASFVFLAIQMVVGVEKFSLFKTMNPNIMIQDAIRYPSFLSDPQTYSQFLAALSFICLIRDPREEKFSKWNYAFVVLALVSILSAGGRGGLMGWVAGISVVVLFGSSSYRYATVAVIITLYTIAMNFQDKFSIFKRSTDLDETYEFRYSIWMDALDMFNKHPFFGIGLSNYANYVAVHHPDQVMVVDNQPVYFDQPESGYLKYLTELGGIGFLCIFLCILIPMVRSFLYYLFSKDTSLILLIAAVLSWMVGFYSTFSFGDTRIKLMIVTIICLMITSRQRLEAMYDEANEGYHPEELEKQESIA